VNCMFAVCCGRVRLIGLFVCCEWRVGAFVVSGYVVKSVVDESGETDEDNS
jgi:hypothetical protein